MSLIAYFWCLLGLYLGVFINLNPGCGSCYMNEETVYTFNPLLSLSVLPWRQAGDRYEWKIAATRSDLREITDEKRISIIHFIITILKYFMFILLFINDLRFAKNSPNSCKIGLFICISEKKQYQNLRNFQNWQNECWSGRPTSAQIV